VVSKKARKKSSQTTSAQQQEAAARRRSVAAPAGRNRVVPPPAPKPDAPGQPAPAREIRHYLDVSAVRIQDWLTRTPDLKFRRGASVLLTEATARDAVDGEMPPGMRWNDQAGELDGVVTLVVEDSVADDEVEACLEAAAHAVAGRMRAIMPYCPVQAVSGQGDSYAAAYEEMEQARRDGSYLADSPPVPPEVILAKPCDQCRSAAAVRQGITIIAAEPRKDLCLDCHARFDAAGGTKGDDHRRRSPQPERRMKEALQAAGMQVTGFPDNFKAMAAAGQHDKDDAATQLALIYADGNKVGAFLSEAARYARRGGSPAKADIVPALDHATVTALADAIMNRFGGWSRPPVLANLAGGDDLLVSVPAIDAWLFVRTLLEAFGTRLEEGTRGWPKPVRELVPSLSAGLVFHHLTAPFSDVLRIAEGQLDLAKKAGRGEGPAVAFLDLTADGGHEPPGREPLTLAYLTRNGGLLERIERIPKSRRETLVTLHRQAFETDVTGGRADAETPGEEFIRRLTDLDNRPLWEAAAGRGAGPDDARRAIAGRPETLDELRRLLDVARYWHTAPRAETAPRIPEAVMA
jgi:hypothetical protein